MAAVLVLAWPRDGWVSGAMSASAVSRHYSISIMELSYAFGDDPPPSRAFLEAEARSWREKLAELMPAVDRWLAAEVRAKQLAPVDVGLTTALVEDPSPTEPGAPLVRPTLVALPLCSIAPRNLGVVLHVALNTLPGPGERTALGKRLCAALGVERADASTSLSLLGELRRDTEGLALTLSGNFSVPTERLAAVNQARSAFLAKGAETVLGASHRFEAQHPGVSLRLPGSPGGATVLYSTHTPIGVFDVRTTVVVAPGAKPPAETQLNNALYKAWSAAGLPVQVELAQLIRSPSR